MLDLVLDDLPMDSMRMVRVSDGDGRDALTS